MTRILRTLTLSAILTAAFAASAQTPSQNTAGGNPAMRGERHSFYFGGLRANPNNAPLSNAQAIKRPGAQFGPVTPVPEPSEWAMLVVGLTFVGWIIRRKTKQ
jgi:hypothetical protein